MVILADHLDVPSRTLCLMVFICCEWTVLLIMNTSLMSSKISGLFRSLIFMRSFMAMMMFCVRSSAPCFELFSAAPAVNETELIENPHAYTYGKRYRVYSAPLNTRTALWVT